VFNGWRGAGVRFGSRSKALGVWRYRCLEQSPAECQHPKGELVGWCESHALETLFSDLLGAFFQLERKSVATCL